MCRRCLSRCRLLLAGLVLVSAACGGEKAVKPAKAVEARPVGNHFLGSEPVYAHLVNASGGSWVFTTVTRSDAPIDAGYLVRLNDLTPAFDIRVAECAPQAYPTSHRCSLTHPFRDKDAGVLNKIINSGIAVGTAGKVTEISQSYETSFDEPTFNQAVDEALVNTGLDLSRRPFIESLQKYESLLARGQADVEKLTQQATAARANTSNVTLRIRPQVSGVVDYYSNDIEFAEIVDLSVPGPAAPPDAGLQSAAPVLPCDARYCAAAAETAVRDLQASIATQKDRLSSLITPNSQVYNVRCEASAHAGYHLEVSCPDVVEVVNGQPADILLDVTVLSRDFANLFPDFSLEDDRLRVQIAGDAVTFTNATSDYLTLTAQTVYYNSAVHTTNAPIDLPPGVSIARALAEFTSGPIEIESGYWRMTPDKAAGTTFRFGYAVRYRVASTAEEVTLHDLGRFNVGCVIDSRLRRARGPCREDPPSAPANPAPGMGPEIGPETAPEMGPEVGPAPP
jgi:hypothetical protein